MEGTYVIQNPYILTFHFYFLVQCSSLTNPNNGMINCSLVDDEASSYEDTCNFTCNTGYELTGSDTRTCQSNGNWSGSNVTCGRGNHLVALHSS